MPTKKLKGADHIYERISADGRLTSYQVKIRRKGFPNQLGSFDDLEAAKRFVREVLGDHDRGHKVDRLIAHRKTVGDVIDDGLRAIESGKRKGAASERYSLNAFKRNYPVLMATPLSFSRTGSKTGWRPSNRTPFCVTSECSNPSLGSGPRLRFASLTA